MVRPSIFPPEIIPKTVIRRSTDGDGDDGDDGGFLYFSRHGPGTSSIGGGVLSRRA